MVKAKKKEKGAEADGIRVVCRNRRASHDYDLQDHYEAGLVLHGTEVKSLRGGTANLLDAYVRVEGDEAWLINAEIGAYTHGNIMNHLPKRKRKLLLHRREIAKLAGVASERGHTIVPLSIYFKGGIAKLEIATAKGKKVHDKRETLKKQSAEREMKREMLSRNRR